MHEQTTSYTTDTLQNDCKSKYFYYKAQYRITQRLGLDSDGAADT